MQRLSKEHMLGLAFSGYGAAWISVLAWALLVNPLLGINGAGDLDNARLILGLVREKPWILFFPALDLILGGTVIAIAIVAGHLSDRSLLNDLQKYAGLLAGTFFIYGAYSRITTFQRLSVANGAAELRHFGYEVVNALQYANSFAVQGFLSAWLIGFHLLQQKRKQGNRMINRFGMLAGLAGLFAFILPPLAALLILANIACSFYWCVHYRKQARRLQIARQFTLQP